MIERDHTNIVGKDTTSVCHIGNGTWIIDSRVSGHTTYDCSFFLFRNPSSIYSIVKANGEFFAILGIRYVRLTSFLTLYNVLYVLDLSYHPIYMPQLKTQSWYSLTFFFFYIAHQGNIRHGLSNGSNISIGLHILKPKKAVQVALILTRVTNQVEELCLWDFDILSLMSWRSIYPSCL